MLIEIIIALAIAAALLWSFSEYLLWAEDYGGAAEFDDEKKNAFVYNLLPPKAVSESRKVVNFWTQYYYAKYT